MEALLQKLDERAGRNTISVTDSKRLPSIILQNNTIIISFLGNHCVLGSFQVCKLNFMRLKLKVSRFCGPHAMFVYMYNKFLLDSLYVLRLYGFSWNWSHYLLLRQLKDKNTFQDFLHTTATFDNADCYSQTPVYHWATYIGWPGSNGV